MFGALDNFFCDLEGKTTATQPHNKQPRTIKKHLQSKPHKNINTLGSALYHLYVSGSLENKGLNGWKDDKEKFKIDLLNDLKTFLFGKWEKPWNPGLIFNDKGEIISGFRNIHGRVFKEGGNVIGLEANKGISPFFITKPAIEKQKGEVNNKQKWVGILSYIPIADEADPKKVKFMLPKFHNVINVDFVDGIKKPVYKTIEFKDLELNEYVENFIKELVKRKRIPTLHYDQADRAYYTHSLLSWTGDSIHLPLIKQFKNIEAFYSTLFHEITHSTMNPDRCGRGKGALSFKTELPYANEELVAEMGSMIISSELGLQYNRQNSLTYLKGWLAKAGKDSDTAMIEAYAYACDAADYLMKDIDFSKLVPASMQKRAEKESPDSPPTEPGKPRKTKTPAKAKAHSKAKETQGLKLNILKKAGDQGRRACFDWEKRKPEDDKQLATILKGIKHKQPYYDKWLTEYDQAAGTGSIEKKIERAEQLGKQAFEAGLKRIPATDSQMNDLIYSERIQTVKELLKAWLKAWDESNLSQQESPDTEDDPKDHYYKINENQKVELHFAYDKYKALSEADKKEIKSHFLFSRPKSAWISKSKDGYWANKIAEKHGLSNAGKAKRLTFSEEMEQKKNRAEGRADRYEGKAAKAISTAESLQSDFNRLRKDWSWLTQPIITGHSGSERFQRSRNRVIAKYEKGFEEQNKALYYQQRAELAKQTANDVNWKNIQYVQNRIKEAEKSIRTIEKWTGEYHSKLNNNSLTEKQKETLLKGLQDGLEKLEYHYGKLAYCKLAESQIMEANNDGEIKVFSKELINDLAKHIKSHIAKNWTKEVRCTSSKSFITIHNPGVTNFPEKLRQSVAKFIYPNDKDVQNGRCDIGNINPSFISLHPHEWAEWLKQQGDAYGDSPKSKTQQPDNQHTTKTTKTTFDTTKTTSTFRYPEENNNIEAMDAEWTRLRDYTELQKKYGNEGAPVYSMLKTGIPQSFPKKDKLRIELLINDLVLTGEFHLPPHPVKLKKLSTYEAALMCVANDPLKKNQTGVYHDYDNQVMVGTDSHILVQLDAEITEADRNKILGWKNKTEIDGRFPDYKRVIPTSFSQTVVMDLQKLSDEVSGTQRAQRLIDWPIYFTFAWNNGNIGLHPDRLLTILTALGSVGVKTVEIGINSAESAILITDTNNPKNIGLVMPVMIDFTIKGKSFKRTKTIMINTQPQKLSGLSGTDNKPDKTGQLTLFVKSTKKRTGGKAKNTLGTIDIIPQMPQMPQMPRAKTEMSPVFIPKEPTDNMAELGFISDFNALQKGETFRLPGALGEFLGEYDRQCYSIALRGEKGAGKSRLVYQLMNAFASQGLNVAFLTLEMSYNSSISIGYRDEYIQPENIARIKPTEKAMTFDELNKVCKQFDVLVIDSWTKLKEMNQTDFDRLQKLNPRTIIVAIFQSTTGGVSRGGNMPEYDAGTVIQVNKGGFAECEKNRYAPCDKIFSVFDKMLIAPEAMEAV